MDNGHVSVSRITNTHISSTRFTDTEYLRTDYFHCVLIINIASCSNNERFLRVNAILLSSETS